MSFDGPPIQYGNRDSLSRDEMDILENKVLPTARRWVREIPGLAAHGRQTLEYWGEPVPDPLPERTRGRRF
jgi:hypothetical protein